MSPPPEALLSLVDDLRSPDPVVRDTGAFTSLAALAVEGRLDRHLVELGVQAMALLRDDEVQARTFGALLLALLVDRDNMTGAATDAAVHAWVASLVGWYAEEPDTRGWDPHLGWLHAVAHGADLLGTLGLHPAVEPVQMLRLGIGRLLTPTPYVLRDMEDDRLGYALAITLTRSELTDPDATEWLDPALRAFATPPAEGITPEVTNTIRTLRALYLLVDHGLRLPGAQDIAHIRERDQVKAKIIEVIRMVTPYYL